MDVKYDSIMGIPSNTFDQFNNYGKNPVVLMSLFVIIILYYIFFFSLGAKVEERTTTKDSYMVFLEVLLWGVFLTLLLLNGMQYFFNVNVTAEIKNLFTDQPEVDITVENTQGSEPPIPEIREQKQLFHIPDNKYTYEDSKALCQAYGARLANYNEMEEAYKKGGEWCSYGWSKDQMALYPTQKKTWEHLQKIKGHEHDCGRPGINGGYIANPNVRFGVNCFGYKPDINSREADLLQEGQIYPKTMKDINFQKRIEYWKTKISDILVSPFNHDVWSLV